MSQYEDLRLAAEGATRGEWKALCDGYGDTSEGRSEEQRRDLLWIRSGPTNAGDIVTTYTCWRENSEADILYIAAAFPDRILGLLATLARVEALADEWERVEQPPDEDYEGTTEGHWAFGEWLATTSCARALRAALAAPTHTEAEGVGR